MDKSKKRLYIQAIGALALNGQLSNFFNGSIYQGKLKSFCVPALNCYSCPGALGACPIGSLQASLASPNLMLPSMVLGSILFYGLILGRAFCGFLCPFGFLQDLFSPIKKKKYQPKFDRSLRFLKYILLIGLVLLGPLITSFTNPIGSPLFCQYLCPSGTLLAGLPLLATNPILGSAIGWLFYWKIALALIILGGSLFIPRLFCRYLCPLGGLFGLMNPLSLYRMIYEKASCIQCARCKSSCPMGIDPRLNQNGPECIRCKECVYICPSKSLSMGFKNQKRI